MSINLNDSGTLQFPLADLYVSSIADIDYQHVKILVNKVIDGFISHRNFWRSDLGTEKEFIFIPALKYFYQDNLQFLSNNIFDYKANNFWVKIPVDSHEFYVKNPRSLFNKQITMYDLINKIKYENDLKQNEDLRERVEDLLDESFSKMIEKKSQINLTAQNKDAYLPTGIDFSYAKEVIDNFRKYYFDDNDDYIYRSSEKYFDNFSTIEMVLLSLDQTKDLMIKNADELETVIYSMPEMYNHDKQYSFKKTLSDVLRASFNNYLEQIAHRDTNISVFPRALSLVLQSDMDTYYKNRTYFLSTHIAYKDDNSILNLKKLIDYDSVSVKASQKVKDDINKSLSKVSLISKKLETSKIPTENDKVMYISDFEKLISDMKLLTNSEEPKIDKENAKIILKNYGTNLSIEDIELANKYHLEFEFDPADNFEVSNLKMKLSFLSDLLK